MKPEETRVETFTFPTPKDTKTFDVEVTLNYAPITGPAPFLQRVEAESSKGSQDPVFQPIEIVKYAENISSQIGRLAGGKWRAANGRCFYVRDRRDSRR